MAKIRKDSKSIVVTLPTWVEQVGFPLGTEVEVLLVAPGELRVQPSKGDRIPILTSSQAGATVPVESTPLSLIPSARNPPAPQEAPPLTGRPVRNPSGASRQPKGALGQGPPLKKGGQNAGISVVEKARARANGSQLPMALGSAPPASAVKAPDPTWRPLVAALGETVGAGNRIEMGLVASVAKRLRLAGDPITAEEVPQLRAAWDEVFPGKPWSLTLLPQKIGQLRLGHPPGQLQRPRRETSHEQGQRMLRGELRL